MSVAVVIPVRDRAQLLRGALRSVQQQRRLPDEVIVVDDGSTDGSGEVALEMGATVVRLEGAGVSEARNAGLRTARSDRVAFLDSDDEWLPTHLATLRRVRPYFPLVSTAALATNGALVGSQRIRPLRVSAPDRLVWPDNPIVTSAASVDRRAALDAGGFDPALAHSEDLDLWARMLALGPGVVLPAITVRYRIHPGQVSTDVESMREGTARLQAAGLLRATTVRRTAVRDDWDRYRAGTAARPTALLRPRRAADLAGLLAHRALGRIAVRRLVPDAG